jgi:hypothetical protein
MRMLALCLTCLLLATTFAGAATLTQEDGGVGTTTVSLMIHQVSVQCGSGGSYTVNGEEQTGDGDFFLANGQPLSIVATPYRNYRLNTPTFTYDGTGVTISEDGTTVTVDGLTSDLLVELSFSRRSSGDDSSSDSSSSSTTSTSSGSSGGGGSSSTDTTDTTNDTSTTENPNAQDAGDLNTLGVDDLPFNDVEPDAYYANAVAWAIESGITEGTSEETFSPDEPCTRAQIVTFLWRAAGAPTITDADNVFSDLDPNAYYYQAVLWGIQNGVVQGLTPTTFGGNELVTRGQAVTFQWRAAGKPDGEGREFTDVDYSEYYGDAVQWTVSTGITTGTGATTFSPDDVCTRAQIVTFLYRQMLLEGGE